MHLPELSQLHQTAILCIDSYEHGVLQGRLYHPDQPDGCEFGSLTQFLLTVERLLDTMEFPQSYNVVRSFSKPTVRPVASLSREAVTPGALATFTFRVMFRQNTSWQGTLRWLDGNMEQSFRSALEMIFLMDSVLTEGEEKQAV